MAPEHANCWEGDLEFTPLARSTCAAGVKALDLHTGGAGMLVRSFPKVRQLVTLLALRKLSSFTALERLSVEDHVTDDGLRALADTCSATLITLRAYSTTVLTDQGLASLAALPHLRDLVLDRGCAGCTEPGLCALLARLADLRSLGLPHCALVGEATMRVVGARASLQSLDLTDCTGVTDAGLAALANLVSLRTLVISWCTRVTDAGLAALAPVATAALRELRADGLDLITDAGLGALFPPTAPLQELHLYGCAQTTEAGHRALRARGVRVVCHDSFMDDNDVSPAGGWCGDH